jgi:hypothetical protein
MENYSSAGTMMCGTYFILCGIWAMVLARGNLGKTKLESIFIIKLTPKVNKIFTYLFGIALIIFGILMVRFGILNPTMP